MIYLASPYHHNDTVIMEERYNEAAAATVELLKAGQIVYSPIVHNHHIAVNFNLPRDHKFWLEYDFGILRHCEKLIILQLKGWEKSLGVGAEIAFAKFTGIPISYMEW